MSTLKVGDMVCVIGAKCKTMDGRCMYLPEQLIDGYYLKHTGTGGAWVGRVEKIRDDMAFVGGAWRGIDTLEVQL